MEDGGVYDKIKALFILRLRAFRSVLFGKPDKKDMERLSQILQEARCIWFDFKLQPVLIELVVLC